jgi:hypothetical protein
MSIFRNIFSAIRDNFFIVSGKAERGYLKSIGQSNADECLYFEKLGRERRKRAKKVSFA